MKWMPPMWTGAVSLVLASAVSCAGEWKMVHLHESYRPIAP